MRQSKYNSAKANLKKQENSNQGNSSYSSFSHFGRRLETYLERTKDDSNPFQDIQNMVSIQKIKEQKINSKSNEEQNVNKIDIDPLSMNKYSTVTKKKE